MTVITFVKGRNTLLHISKFKGKELPWKKRFDEGIKRP